MAGGFFGGLAQGIQSNQEMGLRRRALQLQEETLMNDRQKQLRAEADKAISDTLGLIGGTIAGIKDSPNLSGGIDAYREATASIESAGSGGYQAIGPETDSGDKAYGRYQVMGANIPQWTQEILGKSMTPDEFLASPEAQDKVFDAKFGQYIQETGNVEDAASKWFTGRTLAEAQAAGAADSLGTTAGEYVEKFTRALVEQPRKRVQAAVAPLLRDVEEIAAKTGRDPSRFRRQVDAMILATPTGADKAIAEGQAAGMKKIAEANALISAGVQRVDALAAAGVETTLPNGGKVVDPEKIATIESGMRKEYSSLSQPFIEVRDAYSRIEAAGRNPTPAGDLALIFNFMKMLDPGSVVREGEFATAQNASGVPGRIRNLWNQMLSGARLNEDQRKDLTGQASKLYVTAQKQHTRLFDQFSGIAKRVGVNPENVTVDFSASPEIEAGADNDPLGIR